MFYRKPRTYKGLDHSEAETKVLPPTFAGIKSLVAKLGSEDAVLAAFPVHSLDGPEGEILQEFLDDFETMDKVERETLYADFQSYLKYLKESKSQSQSPSAPAAPASAAAPESQQNNDGTGASPQE